MSEFPADRPRGGFLKWALWGAALIGVAAVVYIMAQSLTKPPEPPAAAKAPAGKTHSVAAKFEHPADGSPAPAYSFKDAAGKTMTVADFKGKVVVLNLWATWCAPCIAELPTLNSISNRADMNVQIITVSQDMEDPAKVQTFLDQKGFAQLPAWLDPKGDLAAHYQVQTLPTSVYYDSNGLEVWRFTGGRDWASAESAVLFAEGNN